jgi:hypothetical protein
LDMQKLWHEHNTMIMLHKRITVQVRFLT